MDRLLRLRHGLVALWTLLALTTHGIARADSTAVAKPMEIESSVVKVFSTIRAPEPLRPWTKHAPAEASGSGVIIEGRRILTNAHVVLYAAQIQVQAYQAGDKVSATVESIAPGIDLAVLKLDDEKLFDTHPALSRANVLPDIKDSVLAYGYPTGGSNLSITKGIVSRIEFAPYHFPTAGLRIQVDAAVNPGNSGGPAVVGDKMIGLTFSSLGGAENIGYIIPNEEIELFLKDVGDGHYDGKPSMYDEFQTLENPALRAFLKLDPAVQGIVVHQAASKERGSLLKTWDVITRIGDVAVDDEGMVQLNAKLRIRFQYWVQRLAKDGKVALTIVRAGKTLTLQEPVAATYPLLIGDRTGSYPPYFVFGPLVFSNVATDFMRALGAVAHAPWLFSSPLYMRATDVVAFPGEELVVVASPMFANKIGKGYSNPEGSVVKAVNGVAIKNLRHLVEVLRDAHDEFITIEFARRGGETLVFSRTELAAATEEILTDNGVRTQASADLMTIWNAKPHK